MPAEIDVAIIGAGKLEHLHKAVTTGKASAILAASIFHFGQVSMPEAKQCLEERGIPMNV
jgi:cyclase